MNHPPKGVRVGCGQGAMGVMPGLFEWADRMAAGPVVGQVGIVPRDGAERLADCGSGMSGPDGARAARARRGALSHRAGLAAEDRVAGLYDRAGTPVCLRRWRGRAGEIDIVARDGDRVIFVEVKQSRTHDEAAMHLTPRQMQRIWLAGSEFLEGEPRGQLTEVRIDVALVDGMGRVEILRDAYAT